MTRLTAGKVMAILTGLIIGVVALVASVGNGGPVRAHISTTSSASAPTWREELAYWPDPDDLYDCARLQHEFELSMGIVNARQAHGQLGGPHLERSQAIVDRETELGC